MQWLLWEANGVETILPMFVFLHAFKWVALIFLYLMPQFNLCHAIICSYCAMTCLSCTMIYSSHAINYLCHAMICSSLHHNLFMSCHDLFILRHELFILHQIFSSRAMIWSYRAIDFFILHHDFFISCHDFFLDGQTWFFAIACTTDSVMTLVLRKWHDTIAETTPWMCPLCVAAVSLYFFKGMLQTRKIFFQTLNFGIQRGFG